MSSVGMLDWVEAAHYVLEQDPPEECFQELLGMLSREGELTHRAIRLGFASREGIRKALILNRSLAEPHLVPQAFLVHSDPRVRQAALEGQSRDQLRQNVPKILALLDSEECEEVRCAWLCNLCDIDTPRVQKAFIKLLMTERSPFVLTVIHYGIEKNGWIRSKSNI